MTSFKVYLICQRPIRRRRRDQTLLQFLPIVRSPLRSPRGKMEGTETPGPRPEPSSVSIHDPAPAPEVSALIPTPYVTPIMICKDSGRPLVALRMALARPLPSRPTMTGAADTTSATAGPASLSWIWVPFLVDSGSHTTIISKLTWRKLGVPETDVPCPWLDAKQIPPHVINVDPFLNIEGPFHVLIEGEKAEVQAAIINDPFDRFGGEGTGGTVLGRDLLSKREATFCFHPWDLSRAVKKSRIMWYDR